MARYVWKDGRFRDRTTGEPMEMPERDGVCLPQIISDIEPYLSPIDGRYISGRAAKRDDLARHDCIDWRDAPRPKGKTADGKFKNKRFAKKYNLPLSEEVR